MKCMLTNAMHTREDEHVSLAICVTGGLHVDCNSYGFNDHCRLPFTHPKQAAVFRGVLQDLTNATVRNKTVRVGMFLSIDPVHYHPHPGKLTQGWRIKVSGKHPNSTRELRGCGTPPLNFLGNNDTIDNVTGHHRHWPSITRSAIAAWGDVTEHLEVEEYVEGESAAIRAVVSLACAGAPVNRQVFGPLVRGATDGFCCGRNVCACTSTYVHFWEQVAKHRACYERVEQHERKAGFRYTWIAKLRPDLNGYTLSHMSHAFLMRMRADTSEQILYLHSPAPDERGTSPDPVAFFAQFAGTDHAALAPRSLADAYFLFAQDVNCSWINATSERVNVPPPKDFRNEHVLSEWLMHRGAQLRRLYWPTQTRSWTVEQCGNASCRPLTPYGKDRGCCQRPFAFR